MYAEKFFVGSRNVWSGFSNRSVLDNFDGVGDSCRSRWRTAHNLRICSYEKIPAVRFGNCESTCNLFCRADFHSGNVIGYCHEFTRSRRRNAQIFSVAIRNDFHQGQRPTARGNAGNAGVKFGERRGGHLPIYLRRDGTPSRLGALANIFCVVNADTNTDFNFHGRGKTVAGKISSRRNFCNTAQRFVFGLVNDARRMAVVCRRDFFICRAGRKTPQANGKTFCGVVRNFFNRAGEFAKTSRAN